MLDLHNNYKMVINGQLVSNDKTLPVFNRARKAPIAHVPDCPKDVLDHAVSAAGDAFKTWSNYGE